MIVKKHDNSKVVRIDGGYRIRKASNWTVTVQMNSNKIVCRSFNDLNRCNSFIKKLKNEALEKLY